MNTQYKYNYNINTIRNINTITSEKLGLIWLLAIVRKRNVTDVIKNKINELDKARGPDLNTEEREQEAME